MIDDDLLKFDLIRIIEKLFQILDKNAFTMEGKKKQMMKSILVLDLYNLIIVLFAFSKNHL